MRIAFVVQRYGREVNGGAETCCRMLAEHLARRPEVDEVTVFTTCALEHITWANHYPPGVQELDGVRIERFPVVLPRSRIVHALLGRLVLHGPRLAALEPLWFLAQGPLAPALPRRLRGVRDHYDVFIFFTYLYYTTVFGLPMVWDRSVLVPTAHDEPHIYLRTFSRLFRLPRAFGFLSPEERDFVVARFGVADVPSAVVGCGVELPETDGWPEVVRCGSQALPFDGLPAEPFLLYLGRIDTHKGCSVLIQSFRDFKQRHADVAFRSTSGRSYRGADLKLVLVGRSTIPLPRAVDLVYPGFVSEERKVALLRRCEVLILPSRLESLSLVLLEAWTMGKPVLANGECAVSVGQISRSGGGIAYHGGEEFQVGLARLLSEPALRSRLGEAGRRYVEQNYRWEEIENRLLGLVAGVAAAASRAGMSSAIQAAR